METNQIHRELGLIEHVFQWERKRRKKYLHTEIKKSQVVYHRGCFRALGGELLGLLHL